MSRLSNLRRALQRLGEPEQPRAERWPATGLSALYGIESASRPAGIKDVSASGVYLLTDERFPANQSVALILRLDGEPRRTTQSCRYPFKLGPHGRGRTASRWSLFCLQA